MLLSFFCLKQNFSFEKLIHISTIFVQSLYSRAQYSQNTYDTTHKRTKKEAQTRSRYSPRTFTEPAPRPSTYTKSPPPFHHQQHPPVYQVNSHQVSEWISSAWLLLHLATMRSSSEDLEPAPPHTFHSPTPC